MHGKRILELMAELRTLPGYEAFRRLEALRWSVYTFDANVRELLSLLQYLTQNPASWELQALRRRDQLHEAEREVARRLHNTVASAYSLVEHTRVLRRHIHSDPADALYRDPARDDPIQRRIESDFRNNPEAKFLQDLRRFVQHHELPALLFQLAQRSAEESVQRRLLLSVSQLCQWDEWSTTSRRFLDQAGSYVDLREAVGNYRRRVQAFYEDFEEHYRGLYQEELEERRRLEWDLILLQIDDELAMPRPVLASGQQALREEAFANIFSTPEFEEIEAADDGPPRGEVIISILERHGPLTDHLRHAIRSFYTVVEQRPARVRAGQPAVIGVRASTVDFHQNPESGLFVPVTAVPVPEPPPLGEARTISDQRVRLSELVEDSVGDYLDRITFERCEILGPAVVVPTDTEFIDCTWDYFGPNARDLHWELTPERRAVIGAIALRGCKFVHCNFARVGFAGTAEYLATWRVEGQFPKVR